MDHEVQRPATERFNRLSYFDPEVASPIAAAAGLPLKGGVRFVSPSDRGIWDQDSRDFAPRIGLAYKLTDKLVMRAGYGIFYALFDRIGSEDQLALNPPGLINNVASVPQTATAPVFLLRHDDSLNKYFVVISSLPVALPGLGTVDLKDSFPKFELPELIQDIWRFSDRPVAVNLDIRRIAVLDHAIEIGANVIFTPATPTGTRGTR